MGFIDSYFDDVLFIPLVVGFALLLQRYFTKRYDFVYTNVVIIAIWVYACIMYEWVYPKFFPYTADWLDLIAYGVGGVIFKFYLNKKESESEVNS